jgi:hypothetical protein
MGRPKKRQRLENETEEDFAAHDMPLDESGDRANVGLRQTGQISSAEETSSTWNSELPGLDMNTFDTAFTPDGTLQPWMLPTNMVDWDIPMLDHQGFDNAIPGLTPDNSSNNTPPTLQFHAEPQNVSQPTHNGHHTHQPQSSTDPTLTDQTPTCACLSTLYLTLSSLATMDPTFPFPTALHPIREAMSTASQAITCPICPTHFITGLQNVQLLNALLMSLAERFSRILSSITAEADALEIHNSASPPSEQKTKTFRLADLSTQGHLHSGGPHCAAAFSLSFTPAEWRSMAKKVVRAEVYGPQDGSECCPYLLGLISQMEMRQERTHRAPPSSMDHPRDATGSLISRTFSMGPECEGGRVGEDGSTHVYAHGKGEHLCLKMLAGTRRMVEGLDWE